MKKPPIKDGSHSKAHSLNKPVLPKKFYKLASYTPIEGGFQITLDERALKTPARANLVISSEPLAKNIAAEWNAQTTHINTHTMPLSKLLFTAIDAVSTQAPQVIDELVRYASSDLICYWESAPEKLVERQRAAWQPILDWAEKMHGLKFITTNAISPIAQPEASLQKFRAIISALNPLQLTAFYTLTTLLGSTMLALAVFEGFITAQTAWDAAHIDEQWNREKWGEDVEDTKLRLENFKLFAVIVQNLGELA